MKYIIDVYDSNGNLYTTRDYDSSQTNFYGSPFDYAEALVRTCTNGGTFTIKSVRPNPVQIAYATYRDHIATTRAGQRNAFRPEWERLTPEIQEAFAKAMKRYVAEGGK